MNLWSLPLCIQYDGVEEVKVVPLPVLTRQVLVVTEEYGEAYLTAFETNAGFHITSLCFVELIPHSLQVVRQPLYGVYLPVLPSALIALRLRNLVALRRPRSLQMFGQTISEERLPMTIWLRVLHLG